MLADAKIEARATSTDRSNTLASYGWKIEREKGIVSHGQSGAFAVRDERRWTLARTKFTEIVLSAKSRVYNSSYLFGVSIPLPLWLHKILASAYRNQSTTGKTCVQTEIGANFFWVRVYE